MEGRLFGSSQEFTVSKSVPSFGLSCENDVIRKRASETPGRSVIKENEHRPPERAAPVLIPEGSGL